MKIAGQSFIEDIRKIAKNTHPVMVKTDKTSEYRQLRARGETSEKARSHTPGLPRACHGVLLFGSHQGREEKGMGGSWR